MKAAKKVSGGGKRARGKIAGRAARANKSTARGKIARGSVGEGKIADLKASEAGMERNSLTALRLWRRENKKRITLFLDADVLARVKEKPK